MIVVKLFIFIFVALATIALMQIGKFLFIDCDGWELKLLGIGCYGAVLLLWWLAISKIGNIPYMKN